MRVIFTDNKLKLTFLADTHHFSHTLGTDGGAYELRSGSDQKCLAETGAIIDAAFKRISESDTDAVMLVGDLSDDGERVCHEEMREKLYALQRSKPVYVTVATHDWCCDGNPRRYVGDDTFNDVPTLGPEQLRDFYFDFGPKQAISEYITPQGLFSYVVELGGNVRLLALNDDRNGVEGVDFTGSGFSEEHFLWIEQQLRDAAENGKTVIGMEHHLLVAHVHKLVTGGSTCVRNREYVASRLADAGLKYMFVGHSHIQDIMRFTSPAGNTLTEVNVGSLCGYPAPIVQVCVENGEVTVEVEYLESFEYNGTQDAQEYLKRHLYKLVDRVLEGAAYGDKAEYAARFSALGLPAEKLLKLRPVIKPAAKFLLNSTAGELSKKLRHLGLGRFVDKQALAEFSDTKTMDFVHDILCSLFDGGRVIHSPDSNYCRLVCGVLSIPSHLFKKAGIAKELNECALRLVTGNELNNYPTLL
ncbi:MAG: metallophosphoesterase [Clostridiales bacterium]|nr:metallophosphoesterase [Clostridiales bacterium]